MSSQYTEPMLKASEAKGITVDDNSLKLLDALVKGEAFKGNKSASCTLRTTKERIEAIETAVKALGYAVTTALSRNKTVSQKEYYTITLDWSD